MTNGPTVKQLLAALGLALLLCLATPLHSVARHPHAGRPSRS